MNFTTSKFKLYRVIISTDKQHGAVISIVDESKIEEEEVPCFDTYPAPTPIPPTPVPDASLQEKAEWRDAIGR